MICSVLFFGFLGSAAKEGSEYVTNAHLVSLRVIVLGFSHHYSIGVVRLCLFGSCVLLV